MYIYTYIYIYIQICVYNRNIWATVTTRFAVKQTWPKLRKSIDDKHPEQSRKTMKTTIFNINI